MAGPFSWSINRPGLYMSRNWHTQKRPYKARLPYIGVQKQIVKDLISPPRLAAGIASAQTSDINLSKSWCYDRFKAKLGENAQIGAGIAEWRSTASSINKNAVQLFQLARAVKHGNPREIHRTLGEIFGKGFSYRKPRKRDEASSIADRWLEYSFGWRPLIADIYKGIDVLCAPFPSATIKGRATVRVGTRKSGSWTTTGVLSTWGTVKCQMLAEVRITNPNLYVNAQLGLINPVSIIWELVPWSFVVDWFTNLGQVLGTLSDSAGCALENAATTILSETMSEYMFGFVPNRLDDYYLGKTVEVTRTVGITGPVLLVRPFSGFSVTRGANALALAVQQLARH